MSTVILAVVAVILCILFRILNVNSEPVKPSVFCKDLNFLETILKMAPLLQEPYHPTRLWGFSGHVQTVVHSIIGRVRCPWPIGERCVLSLKDGTTLTYDVYEPEVKLHPSEEVTAFSFGNYIVHIEDSWYGVVNLIYRSWTVWSWMTSWIFFFNRTSVNYYSFMKEAVTLAICPGIGNTSESVYIRTFVHYATHTGGFRCAVLNHVGALASVPLTSPRIFNYGHTDDFDAMLQHLLERWPRTKLVAVGFSLGGNIITKYMGEQRSRPAVLLGAISICQGYCANEVTRQLLMWQNFRRFYLYCMTENVKGIVQHHRRVLLSKDVRQRHGLNKRDILSAATLPELDEAYTRRVLNFQTVREMYTWSSSMQYFKDIQRPMVFINAKDDPLIPEPLLQAVRSFASQKHQVAHFELAHGGHLGFYEGGLLYPNPVTWLDRALVAIAGAIVHTTQKSAT